MNVEEALGILVALTGHERYRDLCDPGHDAYHPDWPAVVIELATNGPSPELPTATLPLGEALAEWYRESEGLSRRCCGGSQRKRFDPYADLSAEERRLWPFY